MENVFENDRGFGWGRILVCQFSNLLIAVICAYKRWHWASYVAWVTTSWTMLFFLMIRRLFYILQYQFSVSQPSATDSKNKASSRQVNITPRSDSKTSQGDHKSINVGLDFRVPQDFVTVVISSDHAGQEFLIHKQLIILHSPFFKAAFNNESFLEGQTQSMKLEEIDRKIFGLMVHWLYTQQIELNDERIEEGKFILATKLWFLAERFLMRNLQNDTVRAILALLKGTSGAHLAEFVAFIYIIDLKYTALKRVAVDFVCYRRLANFEEIAPLLPEGMLADIALALMSFCRELPHNQTIKMKEATEYFVEVEENRK